MSEVIDMNAIVNQAFEIKEEFMIDEEESDMGSLNHSIAQAQITTLLGSDKRFRVMVELSLEASQIDLTQFGIKAKDELKPDICLYPNTVTGKRRDILRMSEMPLLAIEIVSPTQSNESLVAKFDAYFALGVKSCWLVIPTVKSIAVYSQPSTFKMFDMNDIDVIDEVLQIKLPLLEIFDW
jgi:Uma2 family endonuclease